MVEVPYNSFNELRHTLEKAVYIMRDNIVMCEGSKCEHRDSSLRVRRALYYHFLNILDDMNVIIDRLPDN